MGFKSYHEAAVPLVVKERWLHTGLYSLDILAGRGLCRGKVVQIYGLSQSRKSTLAAIMGAALQKQKCIVGYMDVEGGFLEHVALTCGMDLTQSEKAEINGNDALITPGSFSYCDDLDDIAKTFREMKYFFRACHNGGNTGVAIVDSATRLSTQEEARAGFSGDVMMAHAKRLRQAYRLLLQDLRLTGGILIVLDHQKPTGSAGFGSATEFFATTRIQTEYKHDIRDAATNIIGFESMLHAAKSRYAPHVTAPLCFFYDYGVYEGTDAWWAGRHIGAITQAASWFKVHDIDGSEMFKFQGEGKWNELFNKHLKHRWKEWIEGCLDKYYTEKWFRWVRLGGNDPDALLKKFNIELANTQKAAESAGVLSTVALDFDPEDGGIIQ